MRRQTRQPLTAAVALSVCTLGCIDNTISQQPIREIAVVTGDFDHMSEALDRMLLSYTEYEGFICCASYDSTVDPEANTLKAEGLFGGESSSDGREIFIYDAVFVNSGSRGWGAFEYNGVGEDDQFLKDAVALQNVEDFVNRGGILVLTDWTYDLIEAIWPDKVTFYNEEEEPDAAQVGLIGPVEASVADTVLATKLDQETVNVAYNFSNWTVIESVAEEVEAAKVREAEEALKAADEAATARDKMAVAVLMKAQEESAQEAAAEAAGKAAEEEAAAKEAEEAAAAKAAEEAAAAKAAEEAAAAAAAPPRKQRKWSVKMSNVKLTRR